MVGELDWGQLRVALVLEVVEEALHLLLVEDDPVGKGIRDERGVVALLPLELVLELAAAAVGDRQLQQREVGAVQLQRRIEPPRVLGAPPLPGSDAARETVPLWCLQPEVVRLRGAHQHALGVDRDAAVFVHHQLWREHLLCIRFVLPSPTCAWIRGDGSFCELYFLLSNTSK